MADDATTDTGKDDGDDVELQAPDYAQEERTGGDQMNEQRHDEVWRSGLERKGREAEEEGPMGPLEETFPVRP